MRICVFGSSSERLDEVYLDAAEACGRLLGQGGHTLIFGGGGSGLMGACARGASAAGGETVGVAPRFFEGSGMMDRECSRFVWTESMAERKTAMENEAEGFLVLPGGIGTMEEFFEVLTQRQLGLHGKPIVLLNTRGFFDRLAALLQGMTDEGFAGSGVPGLVKRCALPEEALRALTEASCAQARLRSKTAYFT